MVVYGGVYIVTVQSFNKNLDFVLFSAQKVPRKIYIYILLIIIFFNFKIDNFFKCQLMPVSFFAKYDIRTPDLNHMHISIDLATANS